MSKTTAELSPKETKVTFGSIENILVFDLKDGNYLALKPYD